MSASFLHDLLHREAETPNSDRTEVEKAWQKSTNRPSIGRRSLELGRERLMS